MSYKYHPDLHNFMTLEAAVPDMLTVAEKRAVWREFCLSINRPHPDSMIVENREVLVNGTTLYTVNLETGAATKAGDVTGASEAIRSIAVLPAM